jgi:AcrR family transcriptional regulator
MQSYRDDDLIANLLADLDLPRVPQQARSRQKRDALLAAATHLFQERGYEATTADDIAAAAGVSIGTFYGYFRNKRQVFLTLYADCLKQLLELRIADLDFGPNPREAIRAAVQHAFQRDRLIFGLQRAVVELLPRDPEIAEYNHKLNLILYGQILAAVQRVAEQGLTWPDLQIEPTCWTITTLLDQTLNTPAPDADETDRQRQQTALADLIYHALFRSS